MAADTIEDPSERWRMISLGRTTFHVLWTVAFVIVFFAVGGGRLGTAAVVIFVGLAIMTLISMYLIVRYINGGTNRKRRE